MLVEKFSISLHKEQMEKINKIQKELNTTQMSRVLQIIIDFVDEEQVIADVKKAIEEKQQDLCSACKINYKNNPGNFNITKVRGEIFVKPKKTSAASNECSGSCLE